MHAQQHADLPLALLLRIVWFACKTSLSLPQARLGTFCKRLDHIVTGCVSAYLLKDVSNALFSCEATGKCAATGNGKSMLLCSVPEDQLSLQDIQRTATAHYLQQYH